MRRIGAVLLWALLGSSAAAQPTQFIDPPRPALAAGADTNDAREYAALAAAAKDPDEAYVAFLWAHRLRPTRLDYLAGMLEAVAGARYIRWNPPRKRRAAPAEARSLSGLKDSLERLLVIRDPFFGLPPVDGTCQPKPTGKMPTEDLVIEGIWSLRAGCYYRTIRYLEDAVRRDTMLEHALHFRAMAWHMVQRPEEAAVDLRRAIVGVRRVQASSIEASLYNTGLLEYVAGMMLARSGDNVSARRAFERALVEDLSLHMAHVRLGELAMGRADLRSALESFSLAAQIRPDDALALAAYAQALVAAGRLDEARGVYTDAIARAPHFADLRFAQAELFDRTSDSASAVRAYREYIGRAARADSLQVRFASERAGALDGGK